MKVKLFNKKIEPMCEYCTHADRSVDAVTVLCSKKGRVDLSSHCKKFSYDPLKRKPKIFPVLKDFSPEDFSLD